jgi:hypothetical protein
MLLMTTTTMMMVMSMKMMMNMTTPWMRVNFKERTYCQKYIQQKITWINGMHSSTNAAISERGLAEAINGCCYDIEAICIQIQTHVEVNDASIFDMQKSDRENKTLKFFFFE